MNSLSRMRIVRQRFDDHISVQMNLYRSCNKQNTAFYSLYMHPSIYPNRVLSIGVKFNARHDLMSAQDVSDVLIHLILCGA